MIFVSDREWQMERSFQTAMMIHSPDVVFILGKFILYCNPLVIRLLTSGVPVYL